MVTEKNTRAAEWEVATAISNRFVTYSVEVHRYYEICMYRYIFVYIVCISISFLNENKGFLIPDGKHFGISLENTSSGLK